MGRVRILEAAEDDLEDIWSYLLEVSDEAADLLLSRFSEKFELLSEHPEMGVIREDVGIEGLRSFIVGSYVVFYFAREDGVEIARVIHSRRDVGEALR